MEVLLLLEVKGMKFPLDRRYYIKNGAHMWLKPEGNLVKIGMDAFATEMAGSLTFLNVGKRQVKSGEAIGSFESAKFVSKFYSPISGEIVSVNEKILSNPQLINENPYNSWIVAIRPDNNNHGCKYIIEGKDEISNWISEEIKKIDNEN